jgi:hypothetical protein
VDLRSKLEIDFPVEGKGIGPEEEENRINPNPEGRDVERSVD